jgi:hypothetical protein
MTDWTFHNLSRRGPFVAIKSPGHAIELLMEASGEDKYAICVEFFHAPSGAMDAIVGPEFATLSYDSNYDPKTHSLSGFYTAHPFQPATDHEMYFVDDTETVSSISSTFLLPILEAVRAIEYILIHNDYPEFINWRRHA